MLIKETDAPCEQCEGTGVWDEEAAECDCPFCAGTGVEVDFFSADHRARFPELFAAIR